MKKWVNGPRPNGNSFKEYLDNANDYFINQWIASRFSYGVKEYETEICLEHRDRPFAPLEAPIQPYSCRLETVTYKAYYEFDGERFGVKENWIVMMIPLKAV